MNIKKLLAISLVLAAGILFKGGDAFAATRTWDGSASDGKFSTGANWSGDTAPANGDSVVFPVSAALTVSDQTINNDISNLSLVDIDFTGDAGDTCNGVYKYYTFTGNALTLTGGIDSSATDGTCWNIIEFSLNVTLTASTFTVTGPTDVSGGSDVFFGDYQSDSTLTLGTTDLMYTGRYGGSIYSNVSGSGSISVGGSGGLFLTGDNSGFTGDIEVTDGVLRISKSNALGGGTSPVIIGDGVSLQILWSQSDISIARPITLSGSHASEVDEKLLFAVSYGNCSGADTGDTTLSGSFTLEADAQYSSGCASKLTISNPNLNGHTLTAAIGNIGTLVLGNTEIKPTYTDITLTDNLPDNTLTVQAYIRTILNGVRGDTYVNQLGILKGTGTMGALYVYPGGIVAPGLSPGCLTMGNLDFYGEYQFEAKGATACTEHDQMKVTGTVRLTEDVDVDAKSGTLKVDFLEKYNPAAGTKFVIISNDGADAVAGTFKGLAEGATFEGPNKSVLKISYKGGDGNDVELTVITAGTPNTGFGAIFNNPALTLGVTGLAASAILVMSRRMKPATKRARR